MTGSFEYRLIKDKLAAQEALLSTQKELLAANKRIAALEKEVLGWHAIATEAGKEVAALKKAALKPAKRKLLTLNTYQVGGKT